AKAAVAYGCGASRRAKNRSPAGKRSTRWRRETMFVAKVTGSLVSTQKVETMKGYKLLIVEPYRVEPDKRQSLVTTGRTFVAVDMLGAGVGDLVLLTQGRSARRPPEATTLTTDRVIVGT